MIGKPWTAPEWLSQSPPRDSSMSMKSATPPRIDLPKPPVNMARDVYTGDQLAIAPAVPPPPEPPPILLFPDGRVVPGLYMQEYLHVPLRNDAGFPAHAAHLAELSAQGGWQLASAIAGNQQDFSVQGKIASKLTVQPIVIPCILYVLWRPRTTPYVPPQKAGDA